MRFSRQGFFMLRRHFQDQAIKGAASRRSSPASRIASLELRGLRSKSGASFHLG